MPRRLASADGEQRSTAHPRLDDDQQLRERGQDPVPSREAVRGRRRARGHLGAEETTVGHRLPQAAVAPGVDDVEAAAHDRDRRRAVGRGQRSPVGGTVDALGQPGHHGDPGRGEVLPEAGGHLHAADGGVAGADDGHRPVAERGEVSLGEQHPGRQDVVGQRLGIARPAEQQHGLAAAALPQRGARRPDGPRRPGGPAAAATPPAAAPAPGGRPRTRWPRPPRSAPGPARSAAGGTAGAASSSRARPAPRRTPPPEALRARRTAALRRPHHRPAAEPNRWTAGSRRPPSLLERIDAQVERGADPVLVDLAVDLVRGRPGSWPPA